MRTRTRAGRRRPPPRPVAAHRGGQLMASRVKPVDPSRGHLHRARTLRRQSINATRRGAGRFSPQKLSTRIKVDEGASRANCRRRRPRARAAAAGAPRAAPGPATPPTRTGPRPPQTPARGRPPRCGPTGPAGARRHVSRPRVTFTPSCRRACRWCHRLEPSPGPQGHRGPGRLSAPLCRTRGTWGRGPKLRALEAWGDREGAPESVDEIGYVHTDRISIVRLT